jgi:hypothetical protein
MKVAAVYDLEYLVKNFEKTVQGVKKEKWGI